MILGTDFMQMCGPVSIDHKQHKFWFAQHQEDAINLVNNCKSHMEIPVAIIQDETIPARNTCHLTIQCKWSLAPPDATVYFDPEQSEGNGALLIFLHAIMWGNSGQVCVAVHNCSMQPAICKYSGGKIYTDTFQSTDCCVS